MQIYTLNIKNNRRVHCKGKLKKKIIIIKAKVTRFPSIKVSLSSRIIKILKIKLHPPVEQANQIWDKPHQNRELELFNRKNQLKNDKILYYLFVNKTSILYLMKF